MPENNPTSLPAAEECFPAKIEHQGCNKKVVECVCVCVGGWGGVGVGGDEGGETEGRAAGGTLMMPLLFFSCPLCGRSVRRLLGAQASS